MDFWRFWLCFVSIHGILVQVWNQWIYINLISRIHWQMKLACWMMVSFMQSFANPLSWVIFLRVTKLFAFRRHSKSQTIYFEEDIAWRPLILQFNEKHRKRWCCDAIPPPHLLSKSLASLVYRDHWLCVSAALAVGVVGQGGKCSSRIIDLLRIFCQIRLDKIQRAPFHTENCP